jgi:hypothetical protein
MDSFFRHAEKIAVYLLLLISGLGAGYALRLYHESRINSYYSSLSEEELRRVNSALLRREEFVYNGIRLYPIKGDERRFNYTKQN